MYTPISQKISKVGFPGSSASTESACNAGESGSIPGSRISPGEGIYHPLQYSWASLVAQLIKNLPAMRETWVWSLGWEDSLEEGMATHSSILAWRIPRDRGICPQWGRPGFDPLVGKIPWIRERLLTPVFGLVGKIPWRRERLPIPVFWPTLYKESTWLSDFHTLDYHTIYTISCIK